MFAQRRDRFAIASVALGLDVVASDDLADVLESGLPTWLVSRDVHGVPPKTGSQRRGPMIGFNAEDRLRETSLAEHALQLMAREGGNVGQAGESIALAHRSRDAPPIQA